MHQLPQRAQLRIHPPVCQERLERLPPLLLRLPLLLLFLVARLSRLGASLLLLLLRAACRTPLGLELLEVEEGNGRREGQSESKGSKVWDSEGGRGRGKILKL